jgi:hypothetical protein
MLYGHNHGKLGNQQSCDIGVDDEPIGFRRTNLGNIDLTPGAFGLPGLGRRGRRRRGATLDTAYGESGLTKTAEAAGALKQMMSLIAMGAKPITDEVHQRVAQRCQRKLPREESGQQNRTDGEQGVRRTRGGYVTTAGEMLFLIDSRKCATEYIEVTQGDRFVIEMDSPTGRIVEPALGPHTIIEHHCRSEWYPEGCLGPARSRLILSRYAPARRSSNSR